MPKPVHEPGDFSKIKLDDPEAVLEAVKQARSHALTMEWLAETRIGGARTDTLVRATSFHNWAAELMDIYDKLNQKPE